MKIITLQPESDTVQFQLLENDASCEYVVPENTNVTVVVTASGHTSLEGRVHVHLVGKNAKAAILGLFMIDGKATIKLHTLQHHDARETTSNLLVRSVLSDESRFSYDGAIRVETTGQKTDAYQRNENLMLSNNASAESKPSLEILANDVRCTHGATVGDINEEQLLYLSMRGIPRLLGKQLVVDGFLSDSVEKITDRAIKESVVKILWPTK